MTATDGTAGTPGTGQYAQVNGINLYYETHGSGRPLILLHGGLGSGEMFGPILPALAGRHQVIAPDLQGHGRTADIDRPIDIRLMADDIAALIDHLGLDRPDLVGYSLGGGVALQIAIRHPDVVRKLVAVSTPFKRGGWYPEIQIASAAMNAQVAEAMKQTPLYAAYAKVAPRPQDWPQVVTKLGHLLGTEYDWSAQVTAIKAPVMIVVGDADAVRPAHAVEFFGLLGGGRADAGWDGSKVPIAKLNILPGLTHYTIFATPQLATTVLPFLTANR